MVGIGKGTKKLNEFLLCSKVRRRICYLYQPLNMGRNTGRRLSSDARRTHTIARARKYDRRTGGTSHAKRSKLRFRNLWGRSCRHHQCACTFTRLCPQRFLSMQLTYLPCWSPGRIVSIGATHVSSDNLPHPRSQTDTLLCLSYGRKTMLS